MYLHRCDEPFYTVAQSLCSKHTVHFHPRATRPNDPTPANTEKQTDSSEHKHTNPTYTHWKRNRALKQAASLTVPSLRTGDQIYSALGFLNPDPTTAAELRTSIDTKHTHTHTAADACVKDTLSVRSDDAVMSAACVFLPLMMEYDVIAVICCVWPRSSNKQSPVWNTHTHTHTHKCCFCISGFKVLFIRHILNYTEYNQ